MLIDITLTKAKYRNRNHRTMTQTADGGRAILTRYVQTGFGSKTNNSGKKGGDVRTLRPRRRAYGPW